MTNSDANAVEIVSALRRVGATVHWIESQGMRTAGVPDLLVGRNGATYLLEVKTPRGRLSEAQVRFAADWRGGTLAVVRSVEDALRAVGLAPAHQGEDGSE